MNKKLILFTIFVVLGSLLAACSLPGQAASQPTAQPLPSLQPQGTAVEDNASASLLATISALQTRVAAAPAGAASTSAPKAVPTDAPAPTATAVPTQAPTATAIPVGVAAPKVADPTEVIPTAVLAPTALPQTSGGVPVVYITPIAPLSPYIYSPQPYPYPYYPQSYPNYGQPYPYNAYPNTFVPCNRATFIADVTVPDGTNFAQGGSFTKTWRLRNDGTCTWTTGYSLVFDHGTSLGGPSAIGLPTTVAPGNTVDLSVNLVAPSADGVYQGFWMLQDGSSNRFGIGYNAAVAFWVKITVGAGYAYQGPYPYPAYPYPAYPYPAYPYPYQNQYHYPDYDAYHSHYSPAYASGNCQLIAVSPANGSSVSTKQDMDIRWTIKNTGSSTWDHNAVDYQYVGGTKMYKNSSTYDMQSDVASGGQVDIIVDTIAPSTPGWYSTTWGLIQSGTRLCTMSISLYVK